MFTHRQGYLLTGKDVLEAVPDFVDFLLGHAGNAELPLGQCLGWRGGGLGAVWDYCYLKLQAWLYMLLYLIIY